MNKTLTAGDTWFPSSVDTNRRSANNPIVKIIPSERIYIRETMRAIINLFHRAPLQQYKYDHPTGSLACEMRR